ncbi:hypothetical protein SAMN04489727_1980 [Amycolatopsis tolypomycina]|uniref:Uncharacterized protein n=1 Tax=Amycolatopsis tolypomycina TaxID=208445 RepID=A0A1H4JKK5_9PSEU|nr:hypothetical protein [Amycolatopsis tolypomycina]SEB46697.1 hypothetical protein SAMN04489727_1980 [Amycolatopsis tolypomycina]
MTQRPPSPDGRPRRREDSTRPPRTRRGGELAPYPGARSRTTTGAHGTRAASRPEGTPPRSRRRTSTASPEPTPATVWTCGPDPIDAHETWPVPIVERITTAFTAPGAHVVLIDVGTDAAATTTAATAGATTAATAGAMATGAVVPEAVQEAVRALGRTVTATVVDTPADASGSPVRPFWADLVLDAATPAPAPAAPTTRPAHGAAGSGGGAPGSSPAERADLVLVALPAHAAEQVSLDRLALRAAGLLRYGGIFAVYTHSDWNEGRLVDPTGAVVAAAQHADLLYLQHIVALHTPVRHGRLHAAPTTAVVAEYDRTAHRATVRGLPAPHRRAHSDIQVFAQPTDLGTPPPDTDVAALTPDDEPGYGDLR